MGPEHLVARLKAIKDARMRVRVLVEAFGDGEPTAWVDVVAAIVARAHTMDDADALLAVQSITHAAADPMIPYETRKRLYEAAIAREAPEIARLFLSVSPAVPLAPQLKKQLAPERALKPTSRPITLGERKSLARTHDREQILLMVRDPHPAVVAVLLDNPHVTESDIVKMAASRPAVPESLARIAGHPRWSVRHPVKKALVQNPSTPLADAIRIATTLRTNELAELASDASLREPLRVHAAQLCAVSRRRPPPP